MKKKTNDSQCPKDLFKILIPSLIAFLILDNFTKRGGQKSYRKRRKYSGGKFNKQKIIDILTNKPKNPLLDSIFKLLIDSLASSAKSQKCEIESDLTKINNIFKMITDKVIIFYKMFGGEYDERQTYGGILRDGYRPDNLGDDEKDKKEKIITYLLTKFPGAEEGNKTLYDELTALSGDMENYTNICDKIMAMYNIKDYTSLKRDLYNFNLQYASDIRAAEDDQDMSKIGVSQDKDGLCAQLIDLRDRLAVLVARDFNYLINKYEDISGSVRVYLRINDYLLKEAEEKKGGPHECEEGSKCLGRSYTIKKVDGVPTKKIIIENPCNSDYTYRPREINKTTNNNEAIREDSSELLYKDIKTFGEFFGTYEGISNKDLYEGLKIPGSKGTVENSPGLKEAIKQCTDGYSIILFGYGYSGAGKSHTLLTGKDSMLQSFLNDKDIKGKVNVQLDEIFELYGRYNYDTTLPNMECNKFILFSKERNMKYFDPKYNNMDFSDDDGIKDMVGEDGLLTKIEDFRKVSRPRVDSPHGSPPDKKFKTIKGTPNNPVSSRSHLFIRLKVEKDGEEPGFLTLVDMAGIENPIEIAINIFPFVDLRNIINPFISREGKGASTAARSNYTTLKIDDLGIGDNAIINKNVKNNLINYFIDVCNDLLHGESEFCSDKAFSQYLKKKKDWKLLSECKAAEKPVNAMKAKTRRNVSYENDTTEEGYPISYINATEIKKFTTNIRNIDFMKGVLDDRFLTTEIALTLLDKLKEDFYYKCGAPRRSRLPENDYTEPPEEKNNKINSLLNETERILIHQGSANTNSINFIKALQTFQITYDGTIGYEQTITEKFTLLSNYCYTSLILNGIYKEISELGISVQYIKKGGGFIKELKLPSGEKIIISNTEYQELIQEGIYINESINHLSYYFKETNNSLPPDRRGGGDCDGIKMDELYYKEIATVQDSTIVYPRHVSNPVSNTLAGELFNTSGGRRPMGDWNEDIYLSIKTYLPNKILFKPKPSNPGNDLIKIRSELEAIKNKNKTLPPKYIMTCLIRPEIDAKYCSGARATLKFAQEVCSTCR